jgi:hypothetical protein
MRSSTLKCRRTRAGLAVGIAVGLALASCSSGDDGAAPAVVTPASEGESTTSSPDADPPSLAVAPPLAEAAHVSRTKLAASIVSLKGGGGPDWLATGFGSLWVKRDNNVVARLSPDGKVIATIKAEDFEQPVCQGLGVGAQAVWGCANPGKLMRIDPQTNKVEAVLTLPKVNEQGRLTYYGGRIWVLTGDGDELVGVDESDNKPGRPVDLGAYCTDVADTVVGSTLWVACPYDGTVLRVDLDSSRVTGRVTGLPHPTGVSAGSDVWVCTAKGIAHVDATSLAVVGTQPLPSGFSCSVRAYGDGVWVRTGYRGSPFAARIDPRTGAADLVVTTEGRVSGGDVIEFADLLWVSTFEEGGVYRLRLPST